MRGHLQGENIVRSRTFPQETCQSTITEPLKDTTAFSFIQFIVLLSDIDNDQVCLDHHIVQELPVTRAALHVEIRGIGRALNDSGAALQGAHLRLLHVFDLNAQTTRPTAVRVERRCPDIFAPDPNANITNLLVMWHFQLPMYKSL